MVVERLPISQLNERATDVTDLSAVDTDACGRRSAVRRMISGNSA